MPDSSDALMPTQPYFVLDTDFFRQKVYLKEGISHFFTFRSGGKAPLRFVPDGCLNIFFTYDGNKMEGMVIGTRLKFSYGERIRKEEIFGIRFMPAVQPAIVDVTMRRVLDRAIPIEEVLVGDAAWLSELAAAKGFEERTEIFLKAYAQAAKTQEEFTGKRALIQSVKQMVYESNGRIKVSDMQEKTGYSERYINRIFIEEMGFSPKTFCKIIQFQHSLELLNYGKPENMTEAAVRMGYYDQPQFIRDFKKYAGITPGEYLKLLDTIGYRQKIEWVDEEA